MKADTLHSVAWNEYTLGQLFTFKKGKRLRKEDMLEGTTNYLGAISENNGIRQKIDNSPLFEPNCLTINYNGSVGETFYQDTPFWAFDDVNVLYAKGWKLNEYIGIFIATVIKANKYRFSYGRKWTLEKMKASIVSLPSKKDGSPDWDYMERYIKSLHYKSITTAITDKKEKPLDVPKWKEFVVEKIFTCSTTKPMIITESGGKPYVTRSGLNNGISNFVSDTDYTLNKGNCITIGAEGKVAFYQDKDFVAGVKVYTIRHETLNKYNAMFLCTILNVCLYKYSYGRARILSKIKEELIKLPATPQGSPDWDYMERYIKSLPYADRI